MTQYEQYFLATVRYGLRGCPGCLGFHEVVWVRVAQLGGLLAEEMEEILVILKGSPTK